MKQLNEMTIEDYQKVLELAPMIKNWLKVVEEEALNLLKNGYDIPGFKLAPGKSTRSWKVEEEKLVPKLTKLGIPKQDLYSKVFISPSKLEKLKWVNKKGEENKLCKNQIEVINKEYVVKTQNKFRIVKDSEVDDLIEKPIEVNDFFKPID